VSDSDAAPARHCVGAKRIMMGESVEVWLITFDDGTCELEFNYCDTPHWGSARVTLDDAERMFTEFRSTGKTTLVGNDGSDNKTSIDIVRGPSQIMSTNAEYLPTDDGRFARVESFTAPPSDPVE